MTNQEISKTWEVNLLPYITIIEGGVKDAEKRIESFFNWVETLVDSGNIETSKGVKYIGKEI